MGNLIRAHMARLGKTPIFWLALLVMVPYGLGLCNSAIGDYQAGAWPAGCWGQPLFGFGLLAGIILAAVFGLFFGAEYADGTIRNKLTAGHGRASIYLAALLSALLTAFVLYGVYMLAWAPRLPWMGKNIPAPPKMPALVCLAGTVLLTVRYCSLCTMLSMLIQRRAVLAVVLILLMVLLFTASMQAQDAYESADRGGMELMIDGNGEQQFVFHDARDPGKLLMFLYDYLPGCQAYRFMELDAAPRMLAYSAAATALTTALGLVLFKRKDIR